MSRRRKFLLMAAVVLGVLVIIPVVRHYQLKAAVNRYRAELKAKGEPMELAEVIPPPVPSEQNSADLFLKAGSLLNTNWNVLGSNQPSTMRMVAPGKAMVEWMQLLIRDGRTTNSWREIEFALAEEESAMNMLRTIPFRNTFDFKLNYSEGFGRMKFSPFATAKKAAQRLSASAMNSLHHGDTATASKDIETMLAIVHGMANDRLVISELVRMAIAQMAVTVNWELLQSTNLTDEELKALQSDWIALEFIQAGENALAMERIVAKTELGELRVSNMKSYFGSLDKLGLYEKEGGFFTRLKTKYHIIMWRYWWSYPDELHYLQGMQALLETARQARTNDSLLTLSLEQEKQIEQLGIISDANGAFWFSDPSKANYHAVISSSVISLGRVFTKVIRIEAARQMTITAIALKRFQLKHGSYPKQLADLTPEFFTSVPLDPIDGQPLRYQRNADGTFTLYSIGENGKDDGGNPSLENNAKSKSLQWQNANALDWVWPQPATEAEIQKYYEEQAKQP